MNAIKKAAPAALALALLFVGDAILTDKDVHAAPPSKDARRAFYLTKGAFTGGEALTACRAGFHMASIWEIKQTAFLRYDSTLGRTNGDSAPGGPPAIASTSTNVTAIGWIRTGTGGPSCQNWTSSSPADSGSFGLPIVPPNNLNMAPDFFVLLGAACDGTDSNGDQFSPGVWCVEDDGR